jgi:ABC-type bacteriocin/lantibiotic exporters, contain an N-terminal double-glycine peptidase domain
MKKESNIDNMKMNRMFENQWFLTKLCFRAQPFYMIYLIIESFLQFVLVFVEHVYGIQLILESVELHKPFRPVLYYLIGVAIAIILNMCLLAMLQLIVQPKAKPKLRRELELRLLDKAKAQDLSCYDDPEYYNDFILAISESSQVIERYIDMVTTFFRSLAIVVCYGAFFLISDAVAAVFVFISFIATYVITKLYNEIRFEIRIKKNPLERKREYTNRVFYLNDYAKEIRSNPNISDIMMDSFKDYNEQIYNLDKQYAHKLWRLGFLRNYVTNDFIIDGVYISYLIFQAAVLHGITYSTAVVLFNSSRNLKGNMKKIADLFPQMIANSMYIEKIRTFLQYETKIVGKNNCLAPSEPKIIELKDVSFKYNEKDTPVLKNINMTIKPKEKIALIGYNGAGKTTLIKLLMRLYDVSGGEILLDGEDIKNYDVKAYRKQFGTVFQDYKLYAATLRENVVLDDTDYLKDAKKSDKNICNSLIESGFKDRMESFRRGLDTAIMTEFEKDGINLSGGESQKVAIARVFYEDANIIILDEPSSALDPISEYNLNQAMKRAAENKTVIFISHRLSTTKDADRIVMMEKGCIVETGTHEELLAKCDKYAQMWYAQASRYNYAINE